MMHLNLPPGPVKLPLIGYAHLLVGFLPHVAALSNLSSQYGSVMYLEFGHVPTIVVSSSDAAKEVMKTQDLTFAYRPQLLLDLEGGCALANIELPLATFLYHFDWNLAYGRRPEEVAMREMFGVTTRRKDDLMVIHPCCEES